MDIVKTMIRVVGKSRQLKANFLGEYGWTGTIIPNFAVTIVALLLLMSVANLCLELLIQFPIQGIGKTKLVVLRFAALSTIATKIEHILTAAKIKPR